VLQVASSQIADGMMQWPQTRELIQARLGPTALVVEEKNIATLKRRLQDLGLSFKTLY
jgi:hypothetical protein